MNEAVPGRLVAVLGYSSRRDRDLHPICLARLELPSGIDEVVVVTSRWHSPRAVALFRRAFRGTGIRVTAAPASGPWSVALLLREAACMAALPVQLSRAGRYAGSGSKRSFAAYDGTGVG